MDQVLMYLKFDARQPTWRFEKATDVTEARAHEYGGCCVGVGSLDPPIVSTIRNHRP